MKCACGLGVYQAAMACLLHVLGKRESAADSNAWDHPRVDSPAGVGCRGKAARMWRSNRAGPREPATFFGKELSNCWSPKAQHMNKVLKRKTEV